MPTALTSDDFLAHWQGHRRLTRRVIEAFPDDKLFGHSIGMRSFGTMSLELLGMAVPTVEGVVTGEWKAFEMAGLDSKEAVLKTWDEGTAKIDELWSRIPSDAWAKVVTAFGQYTMSVHALLLYIVDNEVHHRGEGFVYLRSLDIEPPPFYERD